MFYLNGIHFSLEIDCEVHIVLYYRMYELNKEAPWVTFIHGAGGSSAIWYKQIKAYKKSYNILLIDLRGHGKSKAIKWKKGDTFVDIAQDIIDVFDYLNIQSSHFVTISLGTIVVQTIAKTNPDRIDSMVLGGAVIHLNVRTKFFLYVGHLFKYIMPYMWLYRLFAWVIMPKSNHEESRIAFVNAAKKMYQKEFIRWFSLTKSINPYLKHLQLVNNGIPTLFVMGAEDYLFLAPVKELTKKQKDLSLSVIEGSGHVCNIDAPAQFNTLTLQFINHVKSTMIKKENKSLPLMG